MWYRPAGLTTSAWLRRLGQGWLSGQPYFAACMCLLSGAALCASFGLGGPDLPFLAQDTRSAGSTGIIALAIVGGLVGALLGWFLARWTQDYWYPQIYALVQRTLTEGGLLPRVLAPGAYDDLRRLGLRDETRRGYGFYSSFGAWSLWRKPAPRNDTFEQRMYDLGQGMRLLGLEIGWPIEPPGYRALRGLITVAMLAVFLPLLLFGPSGHLDQPILNLGPAAENLGFYFLLHFAVPLVFFSVGYSCALNSVLSAAKRIGLADVLDNGEALKGLDVDPVTGIPSLTPLPPGLDPGPDGTGWG